MSSMERYEGMVVPDTPPWMFGGASRIGYNGNETEEEALDDIASMW